MRALRQNRRCAVLAELSAFAVFSAALDALQLLVAQLVEQRRRILQIGGVEAFGEPVVDLGEHRACLIAAAGVAQQSGKADRRAQLPPSAALLLRDCESFLEA